MSIYTLYRSIITWNNPDVFLPNNDDKMLVVTETKKGLRQINIAYLRWTVSAWDGKYVRCNSLGIYMPDVSNFKKVGATDGQA